METKLANYLSLSESVTREILNLETLHKIPQFISQKISEALNDKIHYAFVHRATNKIYESTTIDSTVKHVLPFFLDEKFIDEMNKLDWSVVDSRGVRFLFEKVLGQSLDIESSFLIIPKKRNDSITHFSILWGGKSLERIGKEEIDFISTICNVTELRIMYLLTSVREMGVGDKELKRKAFELKEIGGMGIDLTSLGKEDFFGGFLLNVMGRALSKTAVIFLSTNENNTEYAVVASRGILKKFFERTHITDKTSFVEELQRQKKPLLISDLLGIMNDEEKDILKRLEATVLFPLLSKNGVIGILTLGDRIDLKPYSEKLFDSINIISNQMVMAIENSKLSNLRYAFSRYVSHQLVDGILSNPDEIKLGGERRKVTILFADIRGFTSMAEKMKPEDVVDLLNTYLSAITEVAFKYEGTLDKYIGDCVMAVFGAPISHYNDTERAVVAAIDMQRYIDEINVNRDREGRQKVAVGIGVNTGYVISGNMGSVDRMDYTVIGDAVNIASRLEGLAERGQILVTRDVYEEVKHLVDARFLDKVSVKGKEKPIEIYEVRDLIARKFISAVEKSEPYKIGHYLTLARDVELIGRRLGFSDEVLIKLRAATMLIDVGQIGLSEGIFNKKDKLNAEEFEVVKSHVLRGAEYVDKKLHLFKEGAELVKHHHECFDGSGYPDGLRGEAIPLWARIVFVVDSYHAMISKRPFREPFKEGEAMRILQEGKGKKYDPRIVDIYFNILNERIVQEKE